MSSGSAPESAGFTPRKEFIRPHRTTSNSFSLLAISGPNLVRFYSFSNQLIAALRHRLDADRQITAFREDVEENLCEFSLEGKPWSSGKAVNTEKLLLAILDVIYQHGYSYLSTIDYGREADDRLAMAFSRARTDTSGSGSLQASPKMPTSSVSINSDKPTIFRVPFALSFPSATVLRVLSPPLHCTPAVLQAVRGSWPRGVVSEKKVGDACFEFRLKGYKWFQQDTFATDSLRHILTLLAALDAHSFTLLTSLSLTNSRSRVKDLWIFTSAPPPSGGDRPDSPSSLLTGDMKKPQTSSPQPIFKQVLSSQHQRLATSPSPSFPQPQHHVHARAATEGTTAPSAPMSPTRASVLRKPAPRAQVPVSVVHEPEQESTADVPAQQQYRANLPSVISSQDNNMTGIGASAYTPDVFYSSSPFGPSNNNSNPRELITEMRRAPSPEHLLRNQTPPLQPSHSPSPPSSPEHAPSTPVNIAYPQTGTPNGSKDMPSDMSCPTDGPLLSAFRDSALSSSTGYSVDVPIAWTGVSTIEPVRDHEESEPQTPKASNQRLSMGPLIPGGWAPTPEEEKSEEAAVHGGTGTNVSENTANENVLALTSRVASPKLKQADIGLRKSEAGLVGMFSVPHPAHHPVPPLAEKDKRNDVSSPGSQGWVIVDVNADAKTDDKPALTESPVNDGPNLKIDAQLAQNQDTSLSSEIAPEASMSPAAKTIVMVDAVDARNRGKSRSSSENSKTGLRRFFSLSKKDKPSAVDDSDAALLAVSEAVATNAQATPTKPKKSRAFRGVFKGKEASM